MGCHAFLQGIFLTRGLNLHLSRRLHSWVDFLMLSTREAPWANSLFLPAYFTSV